jgi:streptogramin lyase
LKTAAACLVVEVPPPASVAATIPLDGANRMTSAAGSLWVNAGGPSGHVVARIDPATNAVLATIALPFPSTIAGDIGYGFGSIWESNLDTQTVTRIDPGSDKVVATIPAQGTGTNGLAFTDSNVWVANHNEPAAVNGANVAKIDPATNQVVATVPIGTGQGGPAWLIEAAGSIWAFDQSHEKIDRIDPGTGSIKTISSPVGRSANRHFATDGTRVWFSVPLDTGPPLVQMINPATNTISTTVSATTLARYSVNTVYGLDFDSGSLWLSGPCGSQACVLRVDASTSAVTGAWSFPGSGDDDALELQFAAGSVWVSEHQAVLRLGIL